MSDPDGEAEQLEAYGSLSENERVGYYIEMWKKSVDVQQHFNDIEWRIRGLALTAATFAIGAAGLAANNGIKAGPVSLGAIIVLVGTVLWYAFYFVDRAWYHPLLKAAVNHGTLIENEIKKSLPMAGMTDAITQGSAYQASWIEKKLSRVPGLMHSGHKLLWFYQIGAAALLAAAVALQLAASFTPAKTNQPPQVIVRLETGVAGSIAPAIPSTTQPGPSSAPSRGKG